MNATAPRVDTFTAIHKALRAMMYATGQRLERTDFADGDARDAALEDMERTLGFFDEHLRLEDKHVSPLLDASAPDLNKALAQEHDEHEQIVAALREVSTRLRSASSTECLAIGAQLCQCFNRMVALQSAHMNREETDANQTLWAAKTDAQLVELRGSIQADIPPTRFAEWLAAMMPSMNRAELVGMLGGVKKAAPPEVYERVRAIAEKNLGDRWAAIAEALG
jgi:hemerythrin-like domain-containing protein